MVAAPVKTLEFYGNAGQELFGWLKGTVKAPREALLEGPAGTGKTHTALQMIKFYCQLYPRSKWLFIRIEKSAMSRTVLPEWEEAVLGPDHFCLRGRQPSRENREVYEFRNQSTVVCRGFDNEHKLFSGQFHGVFFNEATDLTSEEKWETLHRALRAPPVGGQPFKVLLADCNPRHKGHWLNLRAGSLAPDGTERMRRIRTFLHDNPLLFDHANNRYTDFADEYVGGMYRGIANPTLRARLIEGTWQNNSGAVLPQFDPDIHVIDATFDSTTRQLHVKGWPEPVQLTWFFASMDAGFSPSPAVLGIWGVDAQDRMFELCEIYRREWTHEEWARNVVQLAREFRLQGLVCDHDKALIAAINQALTNAGYGQIARIANKTLGMPGTKGKDARIEMMRSRLARKELFYVKGCNRFPDTVLQSLPNRPWNTPMELPNLQHEEFVYGEDDVKVEGAVDKRFPDHGFDMTLYGIAFAAGKRVNLPVPDNKCKPGTIGHMLGYDKFIRRTA